MNKTFFLVKILKFNQNWTPDSFVDNSIKKIKNGQELLAFKSDNIMTIKPDNDFIRPKWGIYRSLKKQKDLRDEAVRFNDFSIKEGE